MKKMLWLFLFYFVHLAQLLGQDGQPIILTLEKAIEIAQQQSPDAVEKDSTTSNIVVARSSGKKELDEESVRLIKNAKITPGKDDGGKIVRSRWTTVINFPVA